MFFDDDDDEGFEYDAAIYIMNKNKFTQIFMNGAAGFVFKKAYEVSEKNGWRCCRFQSGDEKAFAVPPYAEPVISFLLKYAVGKYYPEIEEKERKAFYDTIDLYYVDAKELTILMNNMEAEDD